MSIENRVRRALVGLALALSLTVATTAYAATTFSLHDPGPGATVAPPATVSIRVDADSRVTSGSIKVNGVSRIAAVSYPVGHEEELYDEEWDEYYNVWVVDDYTVADLSCTPPALTPGTTYSATVTASTQSSGTSSDTWSFTVDQAPSIPTITPSNSSTVATLTPTISAIVNDDDQIFSATMFVDGAPVVPLFDPATKSFNYKPVLPLSDWATHSVSITVTDPHGISTTRAWTFNTHWAPKLSSAVPANSSVVAIPRQPIGLTLSDSVAGQLATRLVLDGTTVFSAPVAQGPWAWTPEADLAVGEHAVRAEVTDADGNTTVLNWGFRVVPPALFSAMTPAAGSTVVQPNAVSVRVDADSAINSATFTFGGTTRSATISYPLGHWEVVGFDDWEWEDIWGWVVDDYTVADLSCTPPTLGMGSNTVTVAAATSTTGTSTKSWSFTVDQAPSIGAMSPSDGSTVETFTPTISASIADDDSDFTATMLVDGSPVLAVYDPVSRSYSYRPSVPFADWSNHTVSLTVTDPHGLSSTRIWDFQVHVAPKVSSLAPAEGARVTSTRPPIGLTAVDATTGSLQLRVRVDGAEVHSGAVAQGPWSWTPATDLSAGDHTVEAVVTDATGATTTRSWSFTIVPPADFSAITPAPGSTVTQPGTVSVLVDADSAVTGGSIIVGGVTKTATVSYPIGHWEIVGFDEEWWEDIWGWVVDDYSVADLSCTAPTLAMGQHTATVTVSTASSGTSTQSWSFAVDRAPQVTAVSPANASTVQTNMPTITATVEDDDAELTATMLVNGTAVVPVYDAATRTYSYTPAVPFADWSTPAVSLTVTDPHGLSSTRTWSFGVHVSPKIASQAPAAGSLVTAKRPQIGATVTDGSAGSLQLSLNLDGIEVFSAPVSQGAWSWTPNADLSLGEHTASVTVVDGSGFSTTSDWTFRVVQPATFTAPAPASNAWVASPVSPSVRVDADSKVTGATLSIDGVVKPATVAYPVGHWEIVGFDEEWWEDIWEWFPDDVTIADISLAPQDLAPGTHTAIVSVNTESSGSSTYSWSFNVDIAPQVTTVSPANASKASTFTPTISGVVTDDDASFTARMLVDGAEVTPSYNPTTKTYSYTPTVPFADWSTHTASLTVTDPHGLTATRTWTFQVHVAPKLTSPIPADGGTATSLRPAIGLTASDNVAGSLQMRLLLDGSEVFKGPVSQGAWLWTPTSDITLRTHTARAEVTDASGNTSTLQWSFAPPHMTAPACSTCHVGFPVPNHPVGNCEACHGGDHGEGDDCAGCHGGHTGVYLVNCAGCHTQHTEAANKASHASTTTATTTSCNRCHEGSLILEHSRYPLEGAKYQCVTCHQSANPAVQTAIATNQTACGACHADANHESAHISTSGASCFGSGCHSATKSLSVVHESYAGPGSSNPEFATSCDLCHENSQVDTSTSGTSCIGACHTTSHEQQHVVSGSCIAGGCHPGNAMTIHMAPGCQACHAEGSAPSLACANCHEAEPHAGVSHSTTVTCTEKCHAVADLVSVHGRDCSTCHPLVAEAKPWNRTCDQSGCHPQRHSALAFDHEYHGTARDGEDCWECHDTATPQWDCHSCHIAQDTIAPVTVSNARASYAGGATIALTATDSGSGASGVNRICFRLDGGPVMTGASVVVPPPATGSELHTVEYWAVDDALNSEEPHTFIFEVWPAETIPPATTSDVKSSYVGTATIKLAASDTGGSGVASTHYRLDGGPVQSGTELVVSAAGSHTLEFWSVDHSGNVEAHKTASFTIGAGTGTIYFVWNSPPPGSSATVTVYDNAWRVVYRASSPAWNPPGCFTAVVPVNSKVYYLEAEWYDAGADEEGLTSSTALINAPGKTATFWY